MGNPPQDELTAFGDAVRAAYLAPPDDATEACHLSAMAEEARAVPHEAIPVRSGRGRKEAALTRFRNAALTAKLAALTLAAALATGGLATAGVISLPDSLPGTATDDAEQVHQAIEGSDPSEERCEFGQRVAEAASDGTANPQADGCDAAATAEGRGGKPESGDVEARQNGAEPEEGAGAAFGDSVSDRATGGEPTESGEGFGESVSDEAQQLVPRPTPQAGPETGDTQSQQGQEMGEQGQETGESFSQGGRDIAESHGGGPPQD